MSQLQGNQESESFESIIKELENAVQNSYIKEFEQCFNQVYIQSFDFDFLRMVILKVNLYLNY